MLPDKIMQSDLLDILFENRNKNYGAYAIRKSYNKTLLYATGITLFIATAFSFSQFIHHKNDAVLSSRLVYIPDQDLIKVIEAPKEPKPVESKPVEKKINQKIYSKPVISDKIETTEMPAIEDLGKSIIGAQNIIGADDDGSVKPPVETGAGKGTETVKPEPVKEDKPLFKAQVMPEYPGGIEALKKFMLKNLRQPDDLQAGEKIIVRASFVVNKQGKIELVKIIAKGREDLDKEVIRVINKMPLWKPGMQNGTAVSVYFNLPVTFLGAEE
ncbi:energy transducer TonB [Parafilimonas terrae]|jgi:protein TonB|uniref:Protein TonB n=1 Tax=Parafilimonas terrae TaxID=1465490 RepID=A0A1I5U299_9BACT|nr:energy transducer TonB [Parafilimonas terrae]SFP89445.1 protein TonB [Parafilimonas terrae]